MLLFYYPIIDLLLGFVFEPLRFLLTYILLKGIINIGKRDINLKYKKTCPIFSESLEKLC